MNSYSAEYWGITAAVMAFVGAVMLYKHVWWGIVPLIFAGVAAWLAVRAHDRGYG